MSSHVVIIGGSYAGAKVAHKVLKETPNSKVTLIDASDVFYFNIASPRIIAKPKEAKVDQYLIPIMDKFKHYPANRFTFVQGLVNKVDTSAKIVKVEGKQDISYDYLVVASGSTTPGTVGKEAIPFKTTGADIREKVEDAQKRVAAADSIVIIGAGPVGVEAAGEIAQAYPQTKVTLIASHNQVLPDLKPSAGKSAHASLENLGVKIIYSVRVDDSKQDPSGRFTVTLNNGKTIEAALVISAAGNIANTSFMPRDALDSDGWINVDKNMRVTSVTDKSVYALGDATMYKQRYALKINDQIPVVANNLKNAITNTGALKTYDATDKLMVFVPIGSKTGTGQIGGWVPFSFMVAFAKGKDYFMSRAATFIAA
ncbi:FAD/NAD(P)-binding domain-containing protein [Aureobasidium pullulans]|uniref:FAD/NAD(P)-binding domain-containing protein n=1 Tax=Aureobasidium pullulans TaxID=5580 RepID=A0A4S9L9D5_AURPU|nr:FAD/NAD(P)-binding domain-containing protein [Aureobasidium pullulans]